MTKFSYLKCVLSHLSWSDIVVVSGCFGPNVNICFINQLITKKLDDSNILNKHFVLLTNSWKHGFSVQICFLKSATFIRRDENFILIMVIFKVQWQFFYFTQLIKID